MHVEDPEVEVYLPSSHVVQAAEPPGEYFPAAHETGATDATLHSWPDVHRAQFCQPAREYAPVWQGVLTPVVVQE